MPNKKTEIEISWEERHTAKLVVEHNENETIEEVIDKNLEQLRAAAVELYGASDSFEYFDNEEVINIWENVDKDEPADVLTDDYDVKELF
jgi:hypothetical protein